MDLVPAGQVVYWLIGQELLRLEPEFVLALGE